MRFNRAKEVYEKTEELAKREGISPSAIVLKALIEYLKLHYPGQPTPPLESFIPNGLRAVKLEVKFVTKEIKKLLNFIKEKEGAESYKKEIRRELLPIKTLKLARLNKKVKSEEISKLITTCEEIIDGEVRDS